MVRGATTADGVRELLRSIGFSQVFYVEQDPDCGEHTIWLARRH